MKTTAATVAETGVFPSLFETQEKFADELDRLVTKDMDRLYYVKEKLTRELWSEEKNKLNKLLDQEFQVYRLKSTQVNKYGEITIDKILITVFNVKPGDKVLIPM